MCNQYDKSMIVLSSTVEQADEYITKLGKESVDEKLEFVQKLFDVRIVSKTDADGVTEEESKNMDYFSLLATLINGRGKI